MKIITTSLDADAAVESLKAGIDSLGMRLVCHINGQANAARIGRQVPADQILEVFRPDFAIAVWDACKAAGHDIPLRIHVYETAAGQTRVACRMPSTVFRQFGSKELMKIAAELDEIFEAILKHVPEREYEPS